MKNLNEVLKAVPSLGEVSKFASSKVHWPILLFIIWIGIHARLTTMAAPTILDYDPWWQYRYAKDILENNFAPPLWDSLSFFPPGRPVDFQIGWEYILAVFYVLVKIFTPMTFMEFCKWAPAVTAGLTAVPAYFLWKHITKKWGCISTAFFSVLAPTFMGVSMAGYTDTDAIVTFFSYLCVFTMLHAMKKKNKFSIGLAVVSLWLFSITWAQSWYTFDLLLAFLPIYGGYLVVRKMIEERKIDPLGLAVSVFKKDILPLLKVLLIIGAAVTVLIFISNVFHIPAFDPITSLITGFGFITQTVMLVNVSVAELQPVDIFNQAGLSQIASRIGVVPFYIALYGVPIIIALRLWKERKLKTEDIFIILWFGGTFYLMSYGIRFSLLFAAATAVAAGFVIGNLLDYIKTPRILSAMIFSLIIFSFLNSLSTALIIGLQNQGMEVGANWLEMLDWLKVNADPKAIVLTWWDPGHIITGYSGLRVHADGAHCDPNSCIPYNHNIRIQNMGRMMSTSSEEESIELIKKYEQLTPEQCQQVRDRFGDIVPDDACDPIPEMYFLASNDLISKFTWMNYFGGYTASSDVVNNPGTCYTDTAKAYVWCPWVMGLSEIKSDPDGNPVYEYKYGQLTFSLLVKSEEGQVVPIYLNRYVIHEAALPTEQGYQKYLFSEIETNLEKKDGMLWLSPDLQTAIFFAPAIKDSIFTRLYFFDGQGLKHFEKVFQNSGLMLYKVKF